MFAKFSGSGGKTESLADYRSMYETWCAYNIEAGAVSNTLTGCVNGTWKAGQDGTFEKPLHKQFESIAAMNQYIRGESAIRLYCKIMKDSPTEYEQLLGVTRIGELSYEDCKQQILQLGMLNKVLESVPMDALSIPSWRYEPGVTYRIGGKVYNDPYGLDYKNGPSDIYGDGR